jgi:hypothetical protein
VTIRGPPQHEELADVLDRRGLEPVGQLSQHRLARFTCIGEDADLDEPVRIQRGIRLAHDGWRQAVGANRHHGLQVVRRGAVSTTLDGGQGKGGHRRIIRAP